MRRFNLNQNELGFLIDSLLFQLEYYLREKKQSTNIEVIEYYDKQINTIKDFLDNFNEKHKTSVQNCNIL